MSTRSTIANVLALLRTRILELERTGAGIVRCLTFMHEPNRNLIAECGGIMLLCDLLWAPSVKVTQQAAAALGNITFRCRTLSHCAVFV